MADIVLFILMILGLLFLHFLSYNQIKKYNIEGVKKSKELGYTFILSAYDCSGWFTIKMGTFICIGFIISVINRILYLFVFGWYFLAFSIGMFALNLIIYILKFEDISNSIKDQSLTVKQYKENMIYNFILYMFLGILYFINDEIAIRFKLPKNRISNIYNKHMKEIEEYE